MSVDGISSGGRPPRVGGPARSPGAPGVDGASALEAPKAGAASKTEEATPLDQLHRGEITVDQYLDARVEHAVAHLDASVASEHLDFIRQSLRAQLEVDPVLVELVRRATGATAESET
jgi:hypothetical protein